MSAFSRNGKEGRSSALMQSICLTQTGGAARYIYCLHGVCHHLTLEHLHGLIELPDGFKKTHALRIYVQFIETLWMIDIASRE